MAAPHLTFAGAWNLPQGQWEVHHSFLHYTSDRFYDEKRQRIRQDRYNKYELATFAEYGLTPDLTLGTNFAMTATSSDAVSSWNLGIADPELFARYNLWQGEETALSIQPLLKLPSIARDDQLPRSGTEQMDAEIRLLAGSNFNWLDDSHYFNGELAYRKRFSSLADQIRFDLTAGIRATDQLTIMPQIFTTWRMNEPDRSFRTQIFDNDYNLIKLQFSGLYAITDTFALQGGLFHDAYGRNIGQGNGVFISTWYSF